MLFILYYIIIICYYYVPMMMTTHSIQKTDKEITRVSRFIHFIFVLYFHYFINSLKKRNWCCSFTLPVVVPLKPAE